MLPQTDAELMAFNEGVRIARIPSATIATDARNGDASRYQRTPEVQRALDTLGPDLFWSWADRGYYTHLSTSHQ